MSERLCPAALRQRLKLRLARVQADADVGGRDAEGVGDLLVGVAGETTLEGVGDAGAELGEGPGQPAAAGGGLELAMCCDILIAGAGICISSRFATHMYHE